MTLHALPLTRRQKSLRGAEQRAQQRLIGEGIRARMRASHVKRGPLASRLGVSPEGLDRRLSGITLWGSGIEDFMVTVNAAISHLEAAA